MRANITGLGHFVPEQRLTNADLEKMVDTNDEWITSRTGIKERRILAKDQGTSYMAIRAAQEALEQSGLAPQDVELVLVATVTPDQWVPSMAAIIQDALEADNCWGYDINGGCTGFLCAFATAAQFIQSGTYRRVLVIGADKMSAIVDYADRNTCVLFGDAAGAVVMEPATEAGMGVKDFVLHLDGSGSDALYMLGGGSLRPASSETVQQKMHYIYQDGRTVFKRAVNGMAEASEALLQRNGLGGQDVKLLVPHQANLRIINAVAEKLDLTTDQLAINIEKYGNTTAATIPLALYEAFQDRRIQKDDWVVMTAFGAGFTWGSLLLRWGV
jgi:3-oxoacyl-[acyl-carrier-protein] synthase-3